MLSICASLYVPFVLICVICCYSYLIEIVYSDDIFQQQKNLLVEVMVRDFWLVIDQNRYYPDPVLKKEVNQFIRDYFNNGLTSQEAVFSPTKQSLVFLLIL